MTDLMTWGVNISASDLVGAPADIDAPNVIDSARKRQVALSVTTVGGGNGAHITVEVYFWNTATDSFERTGDSYTLRPQSENFALLSPAGLVLGFSAEPHGGVSDFTLHVGMR